MLVTASDPFEFETGWLLLEFDARACIEENEGSSFLGGVSVGLTITVPVTRHYVTSVGTGSCDDLPYAARKFRWPFDRETCYRLKPQAFLHMS